MTGFLICLAAHAIDADTIKCADGVRIRIQGIEANELHQPGCHLPVCPIVTGPDGKRWMEATVGGKDLRYQPTGKSYSRITAWVTLPDGRDLSCAAIKAGVAVRWEKFDRGGRLRGC